ncbi:YdcF family protein [Martelella endophytica]|uniref:DUF218 domain-containing protein n=1 Tax=Martelella endophytica TaxID=1486262 RepID=A0A0D5LTK1_MAREN|nr:YdcF family protein [Martelella endophytica]AJY47529.1 hypothetical protein TM49_20620 [Martelella endophytica]
MFILSKLFWLVLQPLAFAFLSMLLALFCLAFAKAGAAAVFTILAILVLGLSAFTNAGTVMMAGLESRFSRSEFPETPACAIVLGGGINTGLSARRGSYAFTRAADRYIETLRLARLYPDMKILVTGGDNSLTGNINGEAEPAGRFFADHGIAPERLLYEPEARNTAENAALSAVLMREHGLDGPCLLVTSAYHMPRSVGLFRKQQLSVLPWPVDYRTAGSERLSFSLDRPLINTVMFSTALREWAGLLMARATGRSDAVAPR